MHRDQIEYKIQIIIDENSQYFWNVRIDMITVHM